MTFNPPITATIRNKNTRAAYAQAVAQFFAWCEKQRVQPLEQVKPVVVAAYIETHPGAAPTVKQHLAAIHILFGYLVLGQVVPVNPAAAVREPKHVVKKSKTSVLSAEDFSIPSKPRRSLAFATAPPLCISPLYTSPILC